MSPAENIQERGVRGELVNLPQEAEPDLYSGLCQVLEDLLRLLHFSESWFSHKWEKTSGIL